MKMTESFCPLCGGVVPYPERPLPPNTPPFTVCQGCHSLLKLTWTPFLEKADPNGVPLAVKAGYDRHLDMVHEQRLQELKQQQKVIL